MELFYERNARAEDGRVFSWGKGSLGLLGHRDDEQRMEPTLVAPLTGVHVQQLACGFVHMLARTGTCLCVPYFLLKLTFAFAQRKECTAGARALMVD